MEIERKYLLKRPPHSLSDYPCSKIQQAYLCTEPVIRIRKKDDNYILTYKSAGLMEREELEVPLTEASYHHLLKKCDVVIAKLIKDHISNIANKDLNGFFDNIITQIIFETIISRN